jgi:hypothetical protein
MLQKSSSAPSVPSKEQPNIFYYVQVKRWILTEKFTTELLADEFQYSRRRRAMKEKHTTETPRKEK